MDQSPKRRNKAGPKRSKDLKGPESTPETGPLPKKRMNERVGASSRWRMKAAPSGRGGAADGTSRPPAQGQPPSPALPPSGVVQVVA